MIQTYSGKQKLRFNPLIQTLTFMNGLFRYVKKLNSFLNNTAGSAIYFNSCRDVENMGDPLPLKEGMVCGYILTGGGKQIKRSCNSSNTFQGEAKAELEKPSGQAECRRQNQQRCSLLLWSPPRSPPLPPFHPACNKSGFTQLTDTENVTVFTKYHTGTSFVSEAQTSKLG